MPKAALRKMSLARIFYYCPLLQIHITSFPDANQKDKNGKKKPTPNQANQEKPNQCTWYIIYSDNAPYWHNRTKP